MNGIIHIISDSTEQRLTDHFLDPNEGKIKNDNQNSFVWNGSSLIFMNLFIYIEVYSYSFVYDKPAVVNGI